MDRIQFRRDTLDNWNSVNPILLEGEIGYVLDDPNLHKIGDGVHTWDQLPFRGFDGTIVHDIGYSENAVMSQKVVTEKLFSLGSNGIELPSASVGTYATTSGNPPKKVLSKAVKESQCIDIADIEGSLYGIKDFYIRVNRVSSKFAEVVLFYSKDYHVGTIESTGDIYEGIIHIPDGVDEICINSLIETPVEFYPIYSKEIKEIKKSLDSVYNKTLTPDVKEGYITGTGNPLKIVVSKQSNSIYAEFNLKELSYNKIFVSTKRYSSTLSEVFVFADDDGFYISATSSEDEYVIEKEVVIPEGATKLYVNGYLDNDITIKYSVNILDTIEDIANDVRPENLGLISKTIANNFKGIKSVRFYSPIPYVASRITEFGFNDSDNNFHIVINGMEGLRTYDARPTGGYAVTHDTISFILNPPSNDRKFFYVEVDINWVEYNSANAGYVEISSTPISVKPKHIKELASMKGDIDLYSEQIIPVSCSLNGSNCHIKVHNNIVSFTLGSNVCINNIEFTDVTDSAIIREEYSSKEIDEKPLRKDIVKPLVTETDLSTESSDILFGNNSYGLLRFEGKAVNPSIINCTFNGFNRVIISDSVTRHKDVYHNVVANNMFNSCRAGYYCNSEFTRIYGNYFYGCVFGIIVNCSNFNAVDCIFVRCDCGLYFTSSQNSHGEVSTFEFAHNGVAGIYAKVITDNCGFIFTNSQFAQAPIIAETAYGLKFSSCRMDTWVKILQGAKNSIIGCNCSMSYVTDDGVEKIFNVPTDTLRALNRACNSIDDDSNYNSSF